MIPFQTINNTLVPAIGWAETSTTTNLTPGAIPLDDTIPQNTEGTEILTGSINLKSASSKVMAKFTLCGVPSVAVAFLILAAFRGANANAIAASITRESAEFHTYDLAFIDSPATQGSVTYSIRLGMSSGDFTVNGSGGLRFLGGTLKTTLQLIEILP